MRQRCRRQGSTSLHTIRASRWNASAGGRVMLMLALSLNTGDAKLSDSITVGCKGKGKRDTCNEATLTRTLRDGAPELAMCLQEAPGSIPKHCLQRKYDVTEVVATTYKKLPRFLARQAIKGQTEWFDLIGKDDYSCPLPKGVRPPVIVGGIGDSGTRGVAQLLSDALGHRMCPGESSRGCNKAGDNTVMFKFTGREVLNSALGRIPMLINESREPSRSATLAAMCTAVTETNTRAEAAPGERWGWKSPRSLYYGAFYEQALQGQYKLVHVLRDGRDVATGDNQMQYSSLCGGLNGTNGKATPCSKINEGAAHHRDALRFWAQMNREVFEFGTKVLGPDRYFLFRIEDFVLGDNPVELVERFAKFLGLAPGEPSPEMRATGATLGRAHNMSYGGRKLAADVRKGLIKSFNGVGDDALRFFGYATDDWGISAPPPIHRRA